MPMDEMPIHEPEASIVTITDNEGNRLSIVPIRGIADESGTGIRFGFDDHGTVSVYIGGSRDGTVKTIGFVTIVLHGKTGYGNKQEPGMER